MNSNIDSIRVTHSFFCLIMTTASQKLMHRADFTGVQCWYTLISQLLLDDANRITEYCIVPHGEFFFFLEYRVQKNLFIVNWLQIKSMCKMNQIINIKLQIKLTSNSILQNNVSWEICTSYLFYTGVPKTVRQSKDLYLFWNNSTSFIFRKLHRQQVSSIQWELG